MGAKSRARREPALEIGDAALKPPLHWHVRITWYAGVGENGSLLWATEYLVFTNDVTLAIAYTRKAAHALSGPQRVSYHLGYQELCHEKIHWAGLPDELVAEAA